MLAVDGLFGPFAVIGRNHKVGDIVPFRVNLCFVNLMFLGPVVLDSLNVDLDGAVRVTIVLIVDLVLGAASADSTLTHLNKLLDLKDR